MALAAFFFSLMSLFVKMVGSSIPNQEIVLIRSLITLLLTVAALRRAGVSPWGKDRPLLVLRGLTGFAALSCFFYSIVHLPLAEATVIQFTNPIWTALLASLFLREAFERPALLGTLASFLGVTLIARPAFLFRGWTAQVDAGTALVALCGALMTASAYVCVRRLARSEHPLVVILYFPLVSVPAAALTAMPGWVWPSWQEWVLLLAAAAATQAAQVFLTQGLFREAAGRATSISYLQVGFASLWGFLCFGEIPAWGTLAGGMLILGGCLLVARLRARPIPAGAVTSIEAPKSAPPS